MSTPDLLPELHVTGSFGCKHSDSRRSFGDGEGWAGITHAGRRQGPRRNEGAGATLLPGLQAGGPAPGTALQAPRAFRDISHVVKMPPPLPHTCPSSYPCRLASLFPPSPVSLLFLKALLTHTFSDFSSLQLEVALMAHLCLYSASL